MKGLFITGTGTGVGKTVVSAALMLRYRRETSLRYWKPVQTGTPPDDDTEMVRELAQCDSSEIFASGVRLRSPVSPHLAAQHESRKIDLPSLRESVAAEIAANPETAWIVEGAGGVLVPINETALMIDWMEMLNLPVLIAAHSGLGTINHTLLTVEALRSRSLCIAGVILVGEPNANNRKAIESYGSRANERIRVIGEIPQLNPLSPASLTACVSTCVDPDGTLLEHLR